MALPVKCSFVLIVRISDRRPFCETAYITYQRTFRSQNTGVHGDVVHKYSVCRNIFSRAVGQCPVYETGKPVKLSGIGDFVNCVLCSVAIDVILLSCFRCLLITAAQGAEAVLVANVLNSYPPCVGELARTR